MQYEINYEQLGQKIKRLRHTKVSLNALLSIANALDTSIDSLLSSQYDNPSAALDNEIIRLLNSCNIAKKEKIIKIIEIL